MKSFKTYLIVSILAAGALYSCGGMNDLHDKYLQRGETIYVGQPDSAHVFSGRYRVKIKYWNSDPKVAKLRVYWDFRADSIDFDVPDVLNEGIEIIIDGLEERSYSFEMVTFNEEGKYPSVPLDVTASVYGDEYAATLYPRNLISAEHNFAGDKITITWSPALEGSVETRIEYYTTAGVKNTMIIGNDESTTLIEDIDTGKEITYRTLYRPEDAIDDFETVDLMVKTVPAIKLLDKSKFVRWNPPGIPYQSLVNWPNFEIEFIWDGKYGKDYSGFGMPLGTVLPASFTFDTGQTAKLSHFKVYQIEYGDQLYIGYNTKKFELWGSATPDVNEDFATWIYLGSYESIKPSGLPYGEKTQADIDYALAGHDYTIQENMGTPIRYIRFNILELFNGLEAGQVSEIEMWGEIEE